MNKETKKIAIQDTYGERFQHCWGCGSKNEKGLHLHSYPSDDGNSCICEFIPDSQYTGGIPANLYGGMIAMLFDCHGTASAAWFAHKMKGLELTEDTIIGRFITARLEIDFKKPVPMNELITINAWPEEITEKKAIILLEIQVGGIVRAKAKIIAVGVKDNM